MKARFSSCCPLCGRYIVKGRSKIAPHPNIKGRWVHKACLSEKKGREARPLSEELKPYLRDMIRHETYHRFRGGC